MVARAEAGVAEKKKAAFARIGAAMQESPLRRPMALSFADDQKAAFDRP